jgi:hypothetical protein
MAKVGAGGEWRKVELTYARYNAPGCTPRRQVADGSAREAGEWFNKAREERHVGEFIRRLRRELGTDVEYFKATEFQQDGFTHFHVLIHAKGHKGMIGCEKLTDLWGWGFVWERPVGATEVGYASKGVGYAAKGADSLPGYLLDRSSGTKLNSSSRRFYLDPDPPREKRPPVTHRKLPTIRQIRADAQLSLRVHLRLILATGQEIRATVKGHDTEGVRERLRAMGFQESMSDRKWSGWEWAGREGAGAASEPPAEGAAAATAAADAPSLDLRDDCGMRWRDIVARFAVG